MLDHYQSHAWVDYARGLVSEAERVNMSSHLAGCGDCQRSARAFELLARTTLSPEPPAEVVDRARAIFKHPHPGVTRQLRFERQPVQSRLLYDSAVASVGGIRRNEPTSRRMLFEVGRYFLDLDLGRQPGASGAPQVVVVGQLIDRDEPGRPLPGLGVSLHGVSGAMLASGSSNAMGEFELTCPEQPALQLAVPVDDDEHIEVSLPAPGGAGSRPTSIS